MSLRDTANIKELLARVAELERRITALERALAEAQGEETIEFHAEH